MNWTALIIGIAAFALLLWILWLNDQPDHLFEKRFKRFGWTGETKESFRARYDELDDDLYWLRNIDETLGGCHASTCARVRARHGIKPDEGNQ